jgi:hypothetical protein
MCSGTLGRHRRDDLAAVFRELHSSTLQLCYVLNPLKPPLCRYLTDPGFQEANLHINIPAQQTRITGKETLLMRQHDTYH